MDPDTSMVFYDVAVSRDSAMTVDEWSLTGHADTTLALPGALADSTTFFATVRAIDGHETPQQEPPAVLRFAVDRTPPVGRVVFPTANALITGSAPPPLVFQAQDWSVVSSAMVLLSADGGATWPDTLYRGAYADTVPWIPLAVASRSCKVRLVVTDAAGNSSVLDSDSLFTIHGVSTDVEPQGPPGVLTLRVHPVPARSETRVLFDLPTSANVRLEAFDLAGRLVRHLGVGRFNAGRYSLPWDLRDDGGRRIASGVYFLRLSVGSDSRLSRVVIVH